MLILPWCDSGLEEGLVTLGVLLGVGCDGGVFGQCRLSLLHRLLEWPWIDFEDRLALADVVAFGEGNVRQLAGHQRLHTDGGKSLHVAHRPTLDLHYSLRDRCDRHLPL